MLLLLGALAVTFLVAFLVSMRLAIRAGIRVLISGVGNGPITGAGKPGLARRPRLRFLRRAWLSAWPAGPVSA